MTEVAKDTMPAAHFASQERLEEHYWWHVSRRRIAMALLKSGGLPANPRLLDLGCGTGGFLEQLSIQMKASRALGLDASPVALHSASAKKIDVRQMDLTQPVRLEEEPFDGVTIMDVLEHLPDEGPTLQTARLNLKNGGLLVVSVPAYQFLFSTWDKNLGHYRRYTKSRLVRVLAEKGGFEVLRASYAFSYALPAAIFRRLLGAEYSEDTSVFPPVSATLNGILQTLGKCEAAVLPHMPLPFGLSVCALARNRRA